MLQTLKGVLSQSQELFKEMTERKICFSRRLFQSSSIHLSFSWAVLTGGCDIISYFQLVEPTMTEQPFFEIGHRKIESFPD